MNMVLGNYDAVIAHTQISASEERPVAIVRVKFDAKAAETLKQPEYTQLYRLFDASAGVALDQIADLAGLPIDEAAVAINSNTLVNKPVTVSITQDNNAKNKRDDGQPFVNVRIYRKEGLAANTLANVLKGAKANALAARTAASNPVPNF